MILVLAATGARFSQVQRLRVVDLQIERQRLMMPTSKKGSGESRRMSRRRSAATSSKP